MALSVYGWTEITTINAMVTATTTQPSSTGIHDLGSSTPRRIAVCTLCQRRTASTASTPPAAVSTVPRPWRIPGMERAGTSWTTATPPAMQRERGADPGQERPLVGKREAIVRLSRVLARLHVPTH